jgi:hypothetical protein
MKRQQYARVVWTAQDVLTIRPSWTSEQAEEWLANNERNIVDELITHGWDVIESMLPPPSKEDIEQQS